MKNNSKLISDTELTVVIDPSCHTHMLAYETLASYPEHDNFQQAYFENPSNKCILIRGIKDEYKRTEDNKITLECEQGKYGARTCSYTNHYSDNKKLVYAHKYNEIQQIIQSQIDALKINTNNIEKITIFDISHTDKETKKFSAGFIQEKVDTLKVLNSLCPNCKHTKIASTACWGATKDVNGKDLIDEILTSINKNKDWKKQNIVEIDITPENGNNTFIKIANDNKPHVSYTLHTDMYEDAQLQLPTNFTRTIYLLTKNKQPKIIKQTHNFQKSTSTKNPYRVKEGEGGFYALSIEDITKYLDAKLEKKEFQTIQELKRDGIIKNQDAKSESQPTIQQTKNTFKWYHIFCPWKWCCCEDSCKVIENTRRDIIDLSNTNIKRTKTY